MTQQTNVLRPLTDEWFNEWWETLAVYNLSGSRMYREQAIQFLHAIECVHGIGQPGEEKE